MAWITRATADTYFNNLGGPRKRDWLAQTESDRTDLIQQASTRLDAIQFVGEDTASDKPKYRDANVEDPTNPIPLKLFYAVCELSHWYIANPYAQIISEGSLDSQHVLDPQLADLPIPIQSLVYPFMYGAPNQRVEVETEEDNERPKARKIEYTSDEVSAIVPSGTAGAGATTFLQLQDTPGTYVSDTFLRVNRAGDAVVMDSPELFDIARFPASGDAGLGVEVGPDRAVSNQCFCAERMQSDTPVDTSSFARNLNVNADTVQKALEPT